jgi:hypothetical protein
MDANNEELIQKIMLIGNNLVRSFEKKFANSFIKISNFKFNKDILEVSLIVSNTITSSTTSINGNIQFSTDKILTILDCLVQNFDSFNTIINNSNQLLINWSRNGDNEAMNPFESLLNKLILSLKSDHLVFQTKF